jgi:hypothetical protein
MFLKAFEQLRLLLLKMAVIEGLIHNGRGIWGSDFGSCSFIIRNNSLPSFKGTFKRLFDKQGSVVSSEELEQRFFKNTIFNAASKEFVTIPGSPIAYWCSDKSRQTFSLYQPLAKAANLVKGLDTCDNDRFLRIWHEVNFARIDFKCTSIEDSKKHNKKWFPYAKGGNFRKWYGNLEYVVNWENDGYELRNFMNDDGTIKSRPQNTRYYFNQGITFSSVTISLFSCRLMNNSIFGGGGSGIFTSALNISLGFLNSKLNQFFMSILNPTLNMLVGDLEKFPFVQPHNEESIIALIDDVLSLAKYDWDSFETAWDFHSFPWLSAPLKAYTLETSWQNWQAHNTAQIKRMHELETENNRLFIEAYGLQDELNPEVPEDQITLARADREGDMKHLISYAIGCMMGRYSLDQTGLVYANSGNEGFDHSRYRSFPADDDGIVPVMDMDWFPDDAASRFEDFLKVAFPPSPQPSTLKGTRPASGEGALLEENLTYVADILSPKTGETPRYAIRRYISTQFFKDHMQTYKKRPIYWLFSSGKQRAFECLVYLHRYNEATLSRMRNEYVTPLQGKFAARADYLIHEIDAAATTSARNKLQKQLDVLKKKQAELAAFDDLLRHYADQRIHLDLDDGVKVNYGKFGNLLAEVRTITGGSEG